MSFSQSLSLGEQTLFQLDKCESDVQCNGKNVLNNNNSNDNNKPIVTTANRSKNVLNCKSATVNHDLTSPSPRTSSDNKGLDVIDESPTEKTNILGKSIRERLQNVSTSKKSNRKYMRRSRSDPINGANNSKRSSPSLGSKLEKCELSEDFGSFFDTTMEWDEIKDARASHQKFKISQKLDDKFGNDDFEKYLNDIQTPQIQKDASVRDDQVKNNSLIALCDSDELDVDDVDVSEVKRLMQTEKFDKTAEKTQDDLNDGIEWEDSAFFNELLASQQNNEHGTAPAVEPIESPVIDHAEIDPECISMQSGRHDAIEDELDSCLLEVSMELSNVNATDGKSFSIQKIGSQLDTSVRSRSLTERLMNASKSNINRNHNVTLPKPINRRCIGNLVDWNCSPAIIKAYKKKGILEMFDWQVECLNKPKV